MSQPINLQYTTIKDPLPDFIWQDLKEYSANANSYKSQPEELITLIAKKHAVPKDHMFLIAGCDEGIQLFAKVHGKHTVVFTPTYIVYSDVEVFGNTLTRIPALKDREYKIEPQSCPEATLIFLANPNNPAGYTKPSQIEQLIRQNPQAMVVIDEAYGEFADLSVVPVISKYPNLAVLRSFSKDYGMAGNRIGYMVASPKLVSSIKDFTQWCNVSYLSVGAAISALKHEDHFQKIRQGIEVQREAFRQFLEKAGYRVFRSKINAVLLQFDSEIEALSFVKHLADALITVSHGNGNSNIGLDKTFVRIAIGTEEQMKRVDEVIQEL